MDLLLVSIGLCSSFVTIVGSHGSQLTWRGGPGVMGGVVIYNYPCCLQGMGWEAAVGRGYARADVSMKGRRVLVSAVNFTGSGMSFTPEPVV